MQGTKEGGLTHQDGRITQERRWMSIRKRLATHGCRREEPRDRRVEVVATMVSGLQVAYMVAVVG